MINWTNLRSDGDIRQNFEELCSQLARYESVPKNSKFVRKGTPDAGVECFWKLCNESEWGWQAKWFLTSPSLVQWKEIDNSVTKALDKHPNLVKYVICLPVNRSDARVEGQKSMLDKWNNRVEKWKQIKDIDFEYWGTSEIEDRLNQEQHHGRRKYFFTQEFFSHEWFKRHLKRAINTAGPRYSPELNVQLPLVKKFDALGRTPYFFDFLKKNSLKITEQFEYGRNNNIAKEAEEEFIELTLKIDSIKNILKHADELEQKNIDFKKIHEDAETGNKLIYKIIQKLEKKASANREGSQQYREGSQQYREGSQQYREGSQQYREGSQQYKKVEDFNSELHHLWKLKGILSRIKQWTKSDSCLVVNNAALLLRGNAGNGKTHLFCDVANNRFKNNHFGVLLHGGHFRDGNPKNQILQELDLDCTFEEFIGALDAAGQASNAKTFIMIDALNEGSGQTIWPLYLVELLETVSEYPWVGIAMSVRTSYEPVIIPEHIQNTKLSKFTHMGFRDKTEKATKKFFENNGITRPSIPLLIPEFSNPQFLLILCKGLKNKGYSEIPKGLKGLTSVYDFFIDSVNEKLSKIDFLDYAPHKKIVQKAIAIIAENMSLKNTRYLSYEDTDKFLNQIYPQTTQSKSLLHHIISEGILSQNLMKTEEGTLEQFIQFSYERLGDNLIVQNQLMNITKQKNISKLFAKNGKFSKYFKDDSSLMQYKGIIDAISIQFPEKFSKELIEIKPKFAKSSIILESFIDSFMWRHPTSIKKSSLLQIEKLIIKKRQHLKRFFKMMLTISVDPEIILNGEYLHKYLLKLELGDRDYIWSIFLHCDYNEEDSIVRRYIDWAWNSDKSFLNIESIYLAALALTWFFTSSNRFVRDKATKALVSLLSNNIELFEKLLPKFVKCNDPYVIERLFCAAYGCSMRNNNKIKLKKLAQYTYTAIFKKGTPPTDILLRDYAKSVIDYGLYQGVKLDIDYKKIEPSYNSKWIKSFPTKNTIKQLEKKHEGTPQVDNGVGGIIRSLGQMGDFYLYIVGKNSDSFEWSATPLLNQNKSREKIFDEFQKSITKEQKIFWEYYYILHSKKNEFKNIKKEDREKKFGFIFEDNEFDIRVIKESEKNLRKTLNIKQRKVFEQYIVPYINLSFHSTTLKKHVDLDSFARWIIKKVFDLGWTKQRFGMYDTDVLRRSDGGIDKSERMGKKYQWIAYSELLSRVCDNFEFEGDFNQRKFKEYIAPWQLIGGRNIDPSLLISKTFSSHSYDKPYSSWWFPFNYDSWDSKNDDVEWLKDSSDLPSFESMLEVENPDTQVKWLVLGGHFSLKQKISSDKNSYETRRKNILFNLGSCIAKKSDIEKLYSWGTKQQFQGNRFPKFDQAYNVFLGEFYWAKSVQHIINIEESFWTKQVNLLTEMPAEVHVPIYQYLHESDGYDCSTDEGFNIFLPSKLLVDKMNLTNKNDGTFVDSDDEIVAYDPTIVTDDPKVLLIRKDKFMEFLKNNDYGIIWHIIGEKTILEGLTNHEDWKGCLEIQGVYKITNNKIKGAFNIEFIDRKLTNK